MTALYWTGVLAVEGLPTGDGRELSVMALQWARLPLPLHRLGPADAEAPSRLVGSIIRVWRTPANGVTRELAEGPPMAIVAALGRYTGDEWKPGDQAAIALDCSINSTAIRQARGRLLIDRAELRGAHVGGQPAWPEALVTFTAERPT